jgi:polyisoprenoid-binding protein YceI
MIETSADATSRKRPTARARRRWRLLGSSIGLLVGLGLGFGLAQAIASAPPETSIRFVGANMMSTANGSFQRWRIAKSDVDPNRPGESWLEVEVDVASIDTGIEKRDDHLRSADFFDVKRFPKATVRVHSVSEDGQSAHGYPRFKAKFDVRIRDVKKTVDGAFEVVAVDPPTVEGSLEINRLDFGVGDGYSRWNPMSIKAKVPINFTAVIPAGP